MSRSLTELHEVMEIKKIEPPKRFTFLSVGELFALPAPEWLIEGLIETGALCVHYGPSGSGKSFAALDWALSVATGREWARREVKQGPVVYVVGEGTSGIARRVKAWMKHNEVLSVDNAFFLLQVPSPAEPKDIEDLLARLREKSEVPQLIVLDTLARCFVGDENSAKDMGLFVRGCRELQKETGAALLVVHHTGKAKGKKTPALERGSSALRAAADVMIAQSKKDDLIVISNEKQKDDEESTPIALRLKQIELETDTLTGKAIKSCVLASSESDQRRIVDAQDPCRLNASEREALEVWARPA